MESTERLVRTWMATEGEEEILQLVSGMFQHLLNVLHLFYESQVPDINNGSTTLLNVVKALGEYLTAEEDQLRTKGVELLSSVLCQCSPEKLNHQSVRVLTGFYCSKVEDWDTIIPALKGLAHLTGLPAFTTEEVPKVLDSVFQHVKMKNIVQSVRYNVFMIFDNLIARHRDVLKAMGPNFIERYVNLVEGEKDPRNLLIAFAIARVILIEFEISQFIESLFNITFCYFPITFRPPPNDPYGITTDDLRNALRQCLSATAAFGPLSIPLFLEKLAAGSPATKHDTLVTMSICFPIYGAPLARSNARKLWNALKLEVFQPMSTVTGIDVEGQALQTIQDLVKTIYPEDQPTTEDEDIKGLAKDACEECLNILREPEKSQAKPAIKILCAFMSTTPSICRYTTSQLVPHLLKLFIDPEDVSSRPSVLLLLSDVIAAARDAFNRVQDDQYMDTEGVETPLTPFKDEILSVVASGLKVSSCRNPAIACLLGLISTKGLLTEEELGFIVHSVNELLAEDTEDEDEETSSAALKLLAAISIQAPRHVKEQTLPQLFSALPDRAPPKDDIKARVRYWKALSALTTLCHQPELFEILVIRLTTRLDLLCFPNQTTGTEDDLEPDAAYGHSMLLTIYKVLQAKIDEGHHDIPKYIDSLIPRLFNIFVYSALACNGQYMVGIDPRLITAGGRIITSVVQSLPLSRQESYVQELFAAYYDGKAKGIAAGQQTISSDVLFRPFDDNASRMQGNLVVLLSSASIALRKEIRIPVPDLNVYLNETLGWALSKAENEMQREAIWKMLAAIVNKRCEDAPTFLSGVLDSFWLERIADNHADLSARQRSLRAWSWLSRALLVRAHPLYGQFIDRLFALFGEEEISMHAAKVFGDVVNTDDVLTKRNHAVIKLLHTQRYVNNVLHRLINGAKDTDDARTQTGHLVALSSLISQVPKTLYAEDLPSLLPLLIRGLDLPEFSIRRKVIDTLLAVCEDGSADKGAISEHAPSLVNTMLKNSRLSGTASANVRISALKLLGTLPSVVRYDILHPYKATVIRELAGALDDPKRAVRQEAVVARTSWFKFNG